MSANFSVNPVGLPGAATVVRAPTTAAEESVPTQLPPGRSVAAPDSGNAARMDAQTGQQFARQIVVDEAAAMMVYQVIDQRSGAVVRQFPEQAALRRRAYFRALDIMKDAGAEPPQVSRKA